MEKFYQEIQQVYSHNPTGRIMVFPTAPTPPHKQPTTQEIDAVVDSVKEIISTMASQTEAATATTILEETSTIFETSTEILNADNKTVLEIFNNSNSTISETSTEILNASNKTVLEILNNSNSTITETSTEILNASNKTILEILNNSNSTISEMSTDTNNIIEVLNNNSSILEIVNSTAIEENSTVLEVINATSTEKPNVFDWMSDGVKHNLTMVHGPPEREPDDQTLFIVLGAMLGVLIAISLILLLIYISYRRSNLYTLQERASSDQSRGDVSLQVSSGDRDEDRESELTDDKSGYRF